jgi:DNA recombination protein RmuC
MLTVSLGWLLGGAVLGAVVAYLAMALRGAALKTNLALANQRQADLDRQIAAEKSQTDSLRSALADSQRDLASALAQFDAARQNLADQKQLLEDAQLKLRDAFASASSEALARNNEAFLQLAKERFATLSAEAAGSLDQRKQQIEGLLNPLRQLMDQYQLRVGEIEKSRVESYSMLREQLGSLAEAQRTLNTQTTQLVTALSRPNVRGQWGEISLRRLVELAGLSSRCDFFQQQNIQTDEGRLRPDMLVNLPGGRTVVIDCKATADAFLDAASATDQDQRRAHLQRHAQQVRSRARELSSKNYAAQYSQSAEFVVMFVPSEAFLYAALEHDASLLEDCLKSAVVVATPSTLFALLKVIELAWRHQEIADNASQIRELGIQLYDRLAQVMGHFNKIGSALNSTVKTYNEAVGSVEVRLFPAARKMSELGARNDKNLESPQPVERTAREIPAALMGPES